MAEVDLIVPQRDDIADQESKNWFVENLEEDDHESTAAPDGAPSGEVEIDELGPKEEGPASHVDVNIDIDDQEEEGNRRSGGNRVDGDAPKWKKRRRGRAKKRKWKPYYKLTWTEKQELEDWEAKRANRIRERRWAHGQPVAPYNTTQFLMEDHNVQEPDLETIANGHQHRHHRESTSLESSDEFYSSPEDEEEFLQKEFSAVYESIHAERLNSMTKSELIQEYIQLEDRVDKLEQKLKLVEETRSCSPVVGAQVYSIYPQTTATMKDSEVQVSERWDADSENLEKIRIFQEEIRVLVDVNERLRIENKNLKEKSDSAGSVEDDPSSNVDEEN